MTFYCRCWQTLQMTVFEKLSRYLKNFQKNYSEDLGKAASEEIEKSLKFFQKLTIIANLTYIFNLNLYEPTPKMVKHTQTIRPQIADELFECV